VFFNNVEEVKRCSQRSLLAQVSGGESRTGDDAGDEWVKDCIARARHPQLGWRGAHGKHLQDCSEGLGALGRVLRKRHRA
jgi:hypothetical protein